MGMRFRKSKNIGPVRFTVSKSGISASIGVKGLRVTKLANGRVRTTASVPGTGISYVKESKGRPQMTEQPPVKPKKKKHTLWRVLLLVVLLCVGVKMLPPRSDNSGGWTRLNAADKAVPITPQPGQALQTPDIDLCQEIFDEAVASAERLFPDRVAAAFDSETLSGTISILIPETNYGAAYAMIGTTGTAEAWEDLIISLQEAGAAWQKKFNQNGEPEFSLTMILVNPSNTENALAIVTRGELVYDVVAERQQTEKTKP